MKKILLISPQPFFQWRGSPIRVRFNALALVKAGYAVDLLTLPIGDRCEMEGVNVLRVANLFGVKNIPIGPSLHKLIFDCLLLIRGLALIRSSKYAAIHGIEEAGMIAVILGRLGRCKTIFEKHSDPFSYKKGFLENCLLRAYAAVEKMTVKRVDAVIGTGAGLVEQVEKMGTSTRAFHIFDIPSSLVEPLSDNVEQLRSQLKKTEGEVLLTFVGSFAVYQGVDLLLQTIPEVVAGCKKSRFIIIGGTTEEIEERKRWLAGQGVEQRVDFLGKIPPDVLPDYLAASDVLLSPRISGVNTPLKLLDYLKVGRAICATDVESNRLILDSNTAVLARPEPTVMAKALINLVNDEQRREAMGNKGRELHLQRYNFQEYTKRLSNCYDYVLR